MYKRDKVIPFLFRDCTKQEMVDYLNKKYPISLRGNEDLVNRIYNKYPLVDKATIGIIVKSVFICMRELLVLGKVLNFNKLFFNMKFFVFKHRRDGHILPALRVQISSQKKISNEE